MKILTILGARPQFIKAAAVSREFKKSGIPEIIVHTGQHHDHNMSSIFFDEMEIPSPDYNLGINDLGHGAMTGRMLERIEEVLLKERPDCMLVYGDTNSTLAGALAAAKLHLRVAHVEAGLRSFDMKMPEEINRILTDRISNLLFCPTATAVKNLEQEGFGNFNAEIIQSGDVMFDSVLFYRNKKSKHSTIVQKEKLEGKDFILVTLHRAENTNDPKSLNEICDALNEIHSRVQVLIPLHPRTRSYLSTHQINLVARVIDPVGYFDMLTLLENCKMVMTDSGGLQKESYFFNKFCITLREQTEWVELIEAGANALAGASKEKILDLFNKNISRKVTMRPGLYGDGHAAEKIADSLKKFTRR